MERSIQNRMATIRIKNLRLRTILGISQSERKDRQDVILNVDISYCDAQAILSDDIDRAFNYRTVTKKIISIVEKSEFNLLERLASEVLDAILSFPSVDTVSVEIDKPHALRFADSVSVVVNGANNRE